MKMPKFGSLTNPSKDIVKEIIDIHRHGFDFVEIGIEAPNKPEIIMKRRSEILRNLKRFDTAPRGHTAWWLDLGTEYENIRKATVKEFKKAVDVSSVVGIKLLNVHFTSYGIYQGQKMKLVLDNFVASLQELINYAEKKGVEIMMENVPDKKELASFNSYKYVIDKLPKLKVHLDIGHAFILDGMEGIKSYIFAFRNRLEHIHIHDNRGFSDEHLGLGEGKIDFTAVVKALKKINYNKTITFEVFSYLRKGKIIHGAIPRKYAQQSVNYFKRLWMR